MHVGNSKEKPKVEAERGAIFFKGREFDHPCTKSTPCVQQHVRCHGQGFRYLRKEGGHTRYEYQIGPPAAAITSTSTYTMLCRKRRKNSEHSKRIEEEEVPKFSMPSRKLKGGELAEEDGDG